MIKCIECGFENPDGSDSCLNCGSKLEGQKLSQAVDDISAEATILVGAPMKNPYAAPRSTPEAPKAQVAPPPPTPSAAPKPDPKPAQKPAAPQSASGPSAQSYLMIGAVVAGGVVVAGVLLFVFFKLVGVL
jgi:hypothetical protein